MLTVGSFEAKTHLSQLLEQVELGEEILITRHGHPIAKLVPIEPVKYDHKIKAMVNELKLMRAGQDKGVKTGVSIKKLIQAGRKY
ncbi:MAG: type II toxin-antitoxin system Phd/YefM family antitoxin [Gammaproteobacteria bacterium]|nr:type II toxin-antitoxin system Phd/YefM family antitoxin [Gammaproteobacteria bacterium]